MTSWLVAVAFWFVGPQLVAFIVATAVRGVMRPNPNMVLPEITAALVAPATLLTFHRLSAAAVDAATSAVGYDDAWSVRFVVPAIIAHFICAAALVMVSGKAEALA